MGTEIKEDNISIKKKESFFRKNKRVILLTIGIIIFVCAIVFLLYRFFSNKINGNKLYNNFRIVNVETKEKANRNVSEDSVFIVETDEKINTESLKNHVYISPSIDYEVKKVNAKKYKIVPSEKLVDNQVYTVEEIHNQTATNKWAFETKRKLSVRDATQTLNKGETLKIQFSMENVEDINDYVTISPSISGTWKKHNSTWVYETKEKFQSGTSYDVKISSDLKAGEYRLEGGYQFSAYYYNEETSESKIENYRYTKDSINTFTSKEQVKTVIYKDFESVKGEATAKVYKFKSLDDFKKVVKNDKTLDVSKLDTVYSETGEIKNGVYSLGKNLPNGYYVLEVKYKKQRIYQLVQISDIQAYQITTERDVLVWTIKNGKKQSGIEVEFNGKKIKSNKDGLAIFKNINNGKVNQSYITVDTTSKTPAIILTENYSKNNYPNAYVYTDRPIYKSTDTVQVWGYVSISDFVDEVQDEFTIHYGNKVKRVKVDENGTFTTSIELNNYADNNSFSVELYYKDTYLSSRSVEIYNYTKPMYTYKLNLEKTVFYAGDTINFNVYVEHMTGLPAVEKKVKVFYGDKSYYATTNSSGIATFKIKTEYNKDEYYTGYNDLKVVTGDSEDDYENVQSMASVKVYQRDVSIEADSHGKNGNYSLTFSAKKLNFNKMNQSNSYEEMGEKYNKNATVKIYKNITKKVVTGSYYDDVEGKMVDNIDYQETTQLVDTKTVTLKNGKATINNLKYTNLQTDTEDTCYYADIIMKDSHNRDVISRVYFYYYDDNNDDNINSLYEGAHNYSLNFKNEYDMKVNENEEVPYYILDSKGNVVDDGEVLTIFYKEQILDNTFTSTKNMSFKFTKKMIPGINVAAAYLKNGKVYSVAGKYLDYNEKNKETKIAIKTNKSEYKPGEEVEATVKVVDKDGNPVQSDVNLSVIDKAIFEITEDETPILDTIYTDRSLPMYQSATDREYFYPSEGGLGSTGADFPDRYNFKDTAYFTTVTTDKDGQAVFKFKLPDNVTSYRLTAHSANKEGYVGVNTTEVTATQDFFVESIMPTGVKYSDDLVINAISRGKKANGNVNYVFEINGKKQEASGKVNSYTTVNLGSFPVGEYDLKITATNNELKDTITQKVTIIGTIQEVPVKTTENIGKSTKIKATKNPIVLEIYDEKLQTYLNFVQYLESNYASRIDKRVGLYEADRFKSKFYGNEDFEYGNLNEYVNTDNQLLSTTPNGKKTDVLLTALSYKYINRYVYLDSSSFTKASMEEKDDSKDYYSILLGESVDGTVGLVDLDNIRKEDKNRDNLETILLATSYGFLGDYQTAKEIYKELKVEIKNNQISILGKQVENDDIASSLAILTSMVDKESSSKIIQLLINKNSTSMYLNFAIIAYLENNTEIINQEKHVTVSYGKNEKNVSIHGFNVEKISIDNKDLETLNFKDASSNLKVSYYYATTIDEVEASTIKRDITLFINNTVKKNKTISMKVNYTNNSKDYVDLRIAIPNGLELDQENLNLGKYMYLKSVKNNYFTISIAPRIKKLNLSIPFKAVNEGKYVIEPVVIMDDGIYHISKKAEININK